MNEICKFLVTSCLSDDLVLISHALNCFYDIFSENYYDKVLIELNVVGQMEGGFKILEQKYKKCKKEKSLPKSDLAFAEEALENLPMFIDYKKKEFSARK